MVLHIDWQKTKTNCQITSSILATIGLYPTIEKPWTARMDPKAGYANAVMDVTMERYGEQRTH
jgi:hypothetical protein